MRKRTMIVAGAALVAALAFTGGGLALAAGSDDGDETVTGADADRAVAAALAEVGGGTADGVERDDDAAGAWEVEVRKPDGTTVEVHLDADYAVTAVESDDDESPDDEGSPDDEER